LNETPLNNSFSLNSDPEPLPPTQNQIKDIKPLIKQSETQQQTFEGHLQSEMSQPTNTTSANPQVPPSTSINPAGILGHRTFGSLLKNSGNSFYNIFRKPPMDLPDISTTTPSTTIHQEY